MGFFMDSGNYRFNSKMPHRLQGRHVTATVVPGELNRHFETPSTPQSAMDLSSMMIVNEGLRPSVIILKTTERSMDLLVTMHSSAGKPSALTFIWMPL